MSEVKRIIGMPWYSREDHPRILDIMVDADELHNSFDEFLAAAERGERDLQRQGHTVIRAIIKPDEFLVWCREKGLRPDAYARSEFAAVIAARQIKQ
jgi:hypothetical protein